MSKKPRFKDYADTIRTRVLERLHEEGRMPVASASLILHVMCQLPEIEAHLRDHYHFKHPRKIQKLIALHDVEKNIHVIDHKLEKRDVSPFCFDDEDPLPRDVQLGIKRSAIDGDNPKKLERVPKENTNFLDSWLEGQRQYDINRDAFDKKPLKLTDAFDSLLSAEMPGIYREMVAHRNKKERKREGRED